ncbi:MAG TPA: hypothetical protein VLV89_14070 [Candidatus Acidoferrum sp.]|nr:hypothetical protein [Candidatus Acidoferrum sp.]
MTTLKRIEPGSAFKVGLVVYGILGLIAGACISLISLVGGVASGLNSGGFMGAIFGVAAIVLFPIFYGVIGGVVGALSAVVYNLAAGWTGGLQVVLVQNPTAQG